MNSYAKNFLNKTVTACLIILILTSATFAGIDVEPSSHNDCHLHGGHHHHMDSDSSHHKSDTTCQKCYGSKKCSVCDGTGEFSGDTCPTCGGSGDCYFCDGTGVMN